jgi:Flp pilus assembly protein TadG
MMRVIPPLTRDRRGVAAVEFALIAPVLLILLGGVADFGLIMTARSQLANGVAQGVQYTLLTGPSATVSGISTAVQAGASRSGLTQAVTVTVNGPACYCLSGRPAALSTTSTALSATNTCAGTCPAGTIGPGAYARVTATFTYEPLMPFYSNIAATTVADTSTVRLR